MNSWCFLGTQLSLNAICCPNDPLPFGAVFGVPWSLWWYSILLNIINQHSWTWFDVSLNHIIMYASCLFFAWLCDNFEFQLLLLTNSNEWIDRIIPSDGVSQNEWSIRFPTNCNHEFYSKKAHSRVRMMAISHCRTEFKIKWHTKTSISDTIQSGYIPLYIAFSMRCVQKNPLFRLYIYVQCVNVAVCRCECVCARMSERTTHVTREYIIIIMKQRQKKSEPGGVPALVLIETNPLTRHALIIEKNPTEKKHSENTAKCIHIDYATIWS